MSLGGKSCARRRERGIALIMVMIVIAVLAIIVGAFAYSMRVETILARNSENEPEFDWLGRSGVELARYLVGQQLAIGMEPYDSLNQKWAGGPGNSNSVLATVSLENNPVGKGKFSIKIEDQERKYNINMADEMILRQACVLVGVGPAESSAIVDSILDWRDPDEATHLSGAESEFYLGLTPPYRCKNGPLDDISELLLIRGIVPEMCGMRGVGAPVVAQPKTGGARLPLFQAQAEAVYTNSFLKLFSVASAGLINLNTASADVLRLVAGIDENIAEAIMKRRRGVDGVEGTEDDLPFRSVAELQGIPGIAPQGVQQAARYFGVRSATFEVTVTAELDGRTRTMVALMRRNSPNDVRVMVCRWK